MFYRGRGKPTTNRGTTTLNLSFTLLALTKAPLEPLHGCQSQNFDM